MIYFIREKFDGVIFVRPLSCMSEVNVEPIIKSLNKKHKMHMLTFDLDETTSEINMDNRLDAFIETLRMKNEK